MEPIDRRGFLFAAGAATVSLSTAAPASPQTRNNGAVFLSTWDFGVDANRRAGEIFAGGGSLLDAVEKGINLVEDDPNVTSVGYGGLPNAEGEVELDAGIMDGTTHRAGSVCNLHKIKNPISVARLVMQKTRHTTMAGDGALRFAIEMGFAPQQLLTPKSLEEWLRWRNTPKHETFWIDARNHDTIGMLGVDGRGGVVAEVLHQRPGVEDPRARSRFSACRLRLLRRRCRRRRRDRQRGRDGELLHVGLHRAAHGAGRASARSVRRSHAPNGEDRAEPARGDVLCYCDEPAR
jgi:hypothetical protein